jgi:hypothetical protein
LNGREGEQHVRRKRVADIDMETYHAQLKKLS